MTTNEISYKLAHFEYLDLYILFPADCQDISIRNLLRDVYREKYSSPLEVFDVKFDNSDKRKSTSKCLIRKDDFIMLFSTKKSLGIWVNENGMPHHGAVKHFFMIEDRDKDYGVQGILHEPEEFMIITNLSKNDEEDEQITEKEIEDADSTYHNSSPCKLKEIVVESSPCKPKKIETDIEKLDRQYAKKYKNVKIENNCSLPCCLEKYPRYIINNIRKQMSELDDVRGRENRIEKMKEIFSYVVAHKWFLFDQKKYSNTVKEKFKELQKDMNCDEYSIAYFGVPVAEL